MTFEVSATFCYRDESGQMTETHLQSLYIAMSIKSALISAATWAQNRFETLYKNSTSYPESFLGSVKVHSYNIGKIDQGGYTATRRGMCFFEWKRDYPWTLTEKINSEISNMRKCHAQNN